MQYCLKHFWTLQHFAIVALRGWSCMDYSKGEGQKSGTVDGDGNIFHKVISKGIGTKGNSGIWSTRQNKAVILIRRPIVTVYNHLHRARVIPVDYIFIETMDCHLIICYAGLSQDKPSV